MLQTRPMPRSAYALFDTTLGRCGVAWSDAGVLAVQLPETDDAAAVAQMRRRAHGARAGTPTPEAQRAIDGVTALLRGEHLDLLDVKLDLHGLGELQRRVYELARRIPPGRTRTYGDIAAELGGPHLARAVGQALGSNPFAPVVPCHRVLAAHGRAGGFSAHGGLRTKLALLQIEGADPAGAADLFSPR